jgi:hypothetical protein
MVRVNVLWWICVLFFFACTATESDFPKEVSYCENDTLYTSNDSLIKKLKEEKEINFRPYKSTMDMGTKFVPVIDYKPFLSDDFVYIIGDINSIPSFSLDAKTGELTTSSMIYYFGRLEPIMGEEMKVFIPGVWKFKAVAVHKIAENKYEVYDSEEKEIEVIFPDATEIEKAQSGQMRAVWEETKAAADKFFSYEKGFWIYAVVENEQVLIECGATETGKPFSPCGDGEIELSSPNASIPSTPDGYARYPIAFFHTHTPLTYCNNRDTYRSTGFSFEDEIMADAYGMPSFLYDYVGVIWAKHDIDDSDQLISTGADRRQTPRSWKELETGKN